MRLIFRPQLGRMKHLRPSRWVICVLDALHHFCQSQQAHRGMLVGRVRARLFNIAHNCLQSRRGRQAQRHHGKAQPGHHSLEINALALLPRGPARPQRDQLRATARSDPRCLRFGTRLPKREQLHPAIGVPASLDRRCRKPYSSG
jgi:hypothetical protein